MRYHIRLRGLRFVVRIGVGERERSQPQTLEINADIRVHWPPSNRLETENDRHRPRHVTVADYDRLRAVVEDVCVRQPYHYLEELAAQIGDALQAEPLVDGGVIEATKPDVWHNGSAVVRWPFGSPGEFIES